MNPVDQGNDKLNMYSEKEYSEIIDFPVELVDRDGVVRSYSYRESLAVYQRRLASAPLRYSDTKLVSAEISHCTRRIDQIQRSYLLRGGGADGVPRLRASDLCDVLGEGGEGLFHFYRGALQRRGISMNNLPCRLETLEEGQSGSSLYHLSFSEDGSGSAHLLYVFSLAEPGAAGQLDQLTAQLEHGHEGPGIERVLWRSLDEASAYVLTGDYDVPPSLLRLAGAVTSAANDGGPGAGNVSQRIVHVLSEAVGRGVATRDHYLGLIHLLDSMGRASEGEDMVQGALVALPDDGLLRYQLGIRSMKLGRRKEALEFFEGAVVCDGDLYQAQHFKGLLLSLEGKLRTARMALEDAQARSRGDQNVARAVNWIRNRQRARFALVGFSLAAAALGLLDMVGGHPIRGALVLAMAVLATSMGVPLQDRWALVQFRRHPLPSPSTAPEEDEP